MRASLPVLCAALLTCAVTYASQPTRKAAPEVKTTPLKAVDSVPATKGGFLAWIEPAQADDKGNVYFLTLPEIRRSTDPAAEVPRPRSVLRISADGKKQSTLSPIKSPKLATATRLTTGAITLDPDGDLFMLVWAVWRDAGGADEKTGQYIVSFDKKGEYRSEVEVDWRELGVMQFEVFGSGQFLLRGRRGTNPDEIRLAVLSATGRDLVDVVHSSGPSDEAPELKEAAPGRRAAVGQMVRGGDGRVYVAKPGEQPNETVVYAINTSGESEKLRTLRRMPGDLPLVGLKAAASRFAAVYREGSSESERWWIAIYENMASDLTSPLAVYGPAPGAPVSYQQVESGDRFTFLKQGHFVTMSSP